MTRNTSIFIALAILLATAPVQASFVPDWGMEFGDEGTITREGQYITAVDSDSSGNIYIAGQFTGQIDFGGPTLFSTTPNEDDFFLAKLTASGGHIWSLSGGGTGVETIEDIYVIPGGGVVLAGATSSPVFTVAGESDTTNGSYDALVMMFTSSGVHSFTKTLGGTGFDSASGVVWDPSALSVFVAGNFRNTVDFEVGAPRVSNGGWDLFLAEIKVWASVAAVWTAGGTDNEFAGGLCLDDNGELGFTGSFSGTTNLGTGPLTSTGLGAALVAKFTSVGSAPVWTQVLQSSSSSNTCFGEAIATDGTSFYVTGGFNGSANFGVGNHTSNGDYDLWTAAYKSGGTPVWSRTGGSVEYDASGHIDYHAGQVVVSGSVEEEPTFDSITLYHSNRSDAVLLVYDVSGDIEHARRGGGVWDDFGFDAVANDNGIYFVGSFGENASFSGLTLNALAVAPDGFLVNYIDNPSVGVEGALPVSHTGLTLGAPMPNPLRDATIIEYRSETQAGSISAEVYDLTGRLVRRLESSNGRAAQAGTLRWDGRNAQGSPVAPGIYFVRATDGTSTMQRKVNVLR